MADPDEAEMAFLAERLQMFKVKPGKRLKFKLKDFKLKETVGTGTFGRVMLAKHRKSGTHCVLKILRKSKILQQRQLEHIVSEKTLLGRINYPFIVNMFGCFQDDTNIYMVLEFVPGGELFTYLGDYGKFTEEMVQIYAAEILLSLRYLHNKGIVYRDLKPENILLARDGHLKITDFGFAKELEDRTYTVCGTMDYLAPEIIKKTGHGFGVDFWALGVLIYEMLTGYPPYYDDVPLRICEKIIDGTVDFPNYVSDDARDIVLQLLEADLTKRLGCMRRGAEDILDHPFFASIDWEALERREIEAPILPEVLGDDDTGCFEVYDEVDITEDDGEEVDQELFTPFSA